MSERKLRAVAPDEKKPGPPATMADATETDRRSLLVRSRLEIARTIDGGVPAHALARLISEMERLDSEVRRLDALEEQDAHGSSAEADDSFDASAI